MMPFSKDQNRRIYVMALVVSFLLIVGSIYLHLKQKTHLGRMSFHLDRDRVQPTSGVEATTFKTNNDYDSKYIKKVDEESLIYHTDEQNDSNQSSSSQENADLTNSKQDNTSEDIEEDSESEMTNDSETECLHCLCMTVNECRPTTCGSGYACGLYRISRFYWSDAGKPRAEENHENVGQTEQEEEAYQNCVKGDICSALAIRQYFDRFKRDCNKDGLIDCKDLIALHLLGPNGCLVQNISRIHENRMTNCLLKNNLNYFSSSSEEEEENEDINPGDT